MKIEKFFKPNMVIFIGMDFKRNKPYMVDVTSRKFYSHPHKVDETNTVAIGFILGGVIIPVIAGQLRDQLYINDASQGFKILLIGIGVLIGFIMFYVRLSLEKKHSLPLNEYLKKHPQSEEITNRRQVIGKAVVLAFGAFGFILIGAVGSVITFTQFLNNSNLGTYLSAVGYLVFFSFFIAVVKNYIFIMGLKEVESDE